MLFPFTHLHPLEELKIPKAKEGPSPKKDDGLQQS